MKNAIILHGGPSREEYYDRTMPSMSNAHWIPWLQGQLLKRDIATATPEVPFAFDRNWLVWAREVERFDIGPETILIGHSTGAGFFVKYLSIHKNLRVDKVILVAPYLDPDRTKPKGFFDDYTIDPNFTSRTSQTIILGSDNDEKDIQDSIRLLQKSVKEIEYKEFHGLGHFTIETMKTTVFPELLDLVI